MYIFGKNLSAGVVSGRLHGRRADRRHLGQPHLHALPVRLQQDRSDLARGGQPHRPPAALGGRQLQHETEPGLLAGGAVGVPGLHPRLHQEARPAARFRGLPHLAARRLGRTRLPRHPSHAGSSLQIRSRLGQSRPLCAFFLARFSKRSVAIADQIHFHDRVIGGNELVSVCFDLVQVIE